MDQATAPSTHETGRGQHGSLSAAQVENYVLMAWGCYGAVKLDCRRRGRGREIMSAIGTKQTFQCALLMSAFGVKRTLIGRALMSLLTQSGHRRLTTSL